MELYTARLLLREYREDDLQDLYAIFSDAETMRWCEPPCSMERTADYLRTFRERGIAYAVQHREQGRVIGHLLFHQLPGEEDGIYEIGWFFRRDCWRQGYAYEACRAMMNYGFQTMKLHKLCAETLDPLRSGALAKKLGMAEEGVFRSHTRAPDGTWADVYWYAALNPALERRPPYDGSRTTGSG